MYLNYFRNVTIHGIQRVEKGKQITFDIFIVLCV